MKYSIFISNTQKEFEKERTEVKKYIETHEVFSKLFKVFNVSNTNINNSLGDVYFNNLKNSDIYIALVGNISNFNFELIKKEYTEFSKINGNSNAFFYFKDVETIGSCLEGFIPEIRNQITYTSYNDLNNKIKDSLIYFLSNKEDRACFDSEILLDSSISDVDSEAYNYFLKKCGAKLKGNYLDVLSDKLEVLSKNGDNYHLTVAGALFFTKNPNKFKTIDSKIKLARFRGTDKVDFIDSVTLEGSFLQVLRDVHSFFLRNTSKITRVVDNKRYDFYEYPYEAIREAMVNALAHRDYTLKGGDISFYIFDDRIEIMSPGDLKAPLTTEILNKEDSGAINSIRRNEKISELFHYAHEMEQYGTGIDRIKSSMKKHGLKSPVFRMIGNYLQVILYGSGEDILNLPLSASTNHVSFDNLELNDRQINLLNYLSNNYSITDKEYCNHFMVSENTVLEDIKVLMDNGLIKKHENNNSVFYIL